MELNYKELSESAKNFIKILNTNGVEASVKSSRYVKDIKAVEVASSIPISDLLKSIGVSGKISDLPSEEEKKISGKYKAKLVNVGKDSFFLVNTFTEKGSIKTKQLAPEKLGLIKPYSSVNFFDQDVFDRIKQLPNLEPNVKIVLNELYKAVIPSSQPTIPFNKKLSDAFSTIKPQDRQAIGKDFGEILSLRWCLNQSFAQGFKSFAFSVISNEPLVDYTIKVPKKNTEVVIKISAKFEKGAAPSIKAISENLDKIYKTPNQEQKKAISVLKSLSSNLAGPNNVSSKILASFKALDLPAYRTLKSIIGRDNFTIVDIHNYVQKIAEKHKDRDKRIEEFLKIFNKYYNELGKNATRDSLNVVFADKSYSKGFYSPIISPMGYSLVEYMNKNPIYQEILNLSSRQLAVDQVYLNFGSNSMTFEKKIFSDSKFAFSYGANAKDSNNTGIKFSMV